MIDNTRNTFILAWWRHQMCQGFGNYL